VRIVILEAVTAGGFGIFDSCGSITELEPSSIPDSLLEEAMAMVAGLANDCHEAVTLGSAWQSEKWMQRSKAGLPTAGRFVPWLLRSQLINRPAICRSGQQIVQVFRHSFVDQYLTRGRFATMLDQPMERTSLDLVPSSNLGQRVGRAEFWDPVLQRRLGGTHLSLFGGNHWSVPDPQSESTSQPAGANFRDESNNHSFIMVFDRSELLSQWRNAVREADVAFLIAPQPDMQHWMNGLGSLSHRVLAWPSDLLRRAEDKRYLTSVPSMVVQPQADSWRFSVHDSRWPTDATMALPDLEVQHAFQDHFATAMQWALKPTDQCGSSDVWKISLATPTTDFGMAQSCVQQLRENVPRETDLRQPLLWSPWVDGQHGSLLVWAGAEGWWCFPPCRQCLDFEELPIPWHLESYVTRLQKVRYRGSEMAPELLNSGLEQLVVGQFAAKLTAAECRSIRGWFGIDFVVSPAGQTTLIEVNPRLTSSYNLLRNLYFTNSGD
jgi:hypothetical protein